MASEPVGAEVLAAEIVNEAIRSHGRDAALPGEFVDALNTGIDAALGRYKTALEAIVALDFKKTERGGYDFYTGPDRFIQAWLIAYRAIYPEADASRWETPAEKGTDS